MDVDRGGVDDHVSERRNIVDGDLPVGCAKSQITQLRELLVLSEDDVAVVRCDRQVVRHSDDVCDGVGIPLVVVQEDAVDCMQKIAVQHDQLRTRGQLDRVEGRGGTDVSSHDDRSGRLHDELAESGIGRVDVTDHPNVSTKRPKKREGGVVHRQRAVHVDVAIRPGDELGIRSVDDNVSVVDLTSLGPDVDQRPGRIEVDAVRGGELGVTVDVHEAGVDVDRARAVEAGPHIEILQSVDG